MIDPIGSANRRPAAVLLLVYPRAGEYFTVFTKRSHRVGTHKGEVSLPGGGREAADPTLGHTALRETHEELGVDPSGVTLLKELEQVWTLGSNYLISPFVGYSPETPTFDVQVEEVDVVIEIPIAQIGHPDVSRTEPFLIRGEWRMVSYYMYEGHRIWGATAKILQTFYEELTSGQIVLPDGRPLQQLVLPGGQQR